MFKRKKRSLAKPDVVDIQYRKMGFDFARAPVFWFDNEPVQSHLLNALSLTFPDGERFFVDSVRAFRDEAVTKEQKEDIAGFIGQEAMHSLEHTSFNRMLSERGYAAEVEGGEKLAHHFLGYGRKGMSMKNQLAATAALEHITAIMAEWLMADEKIMEKLDPEVRSLWMWHAIEEAEHKAVAFDLLEQVTGGDYRKRVRVLVPASAFLAVYVVIYTWKFLKRDGLHREPVTVAKGLWQLVRPGGLVPSVVPAWLRYFKPGFHPWEKDDSDLILKWRQILEENYPAAA